MYLIYFILSLFLCEQKTDSLTAIGPLIQGKFLQEAYRSELFIAPTPFYDFNKISFCIYR